MQFWTCLHKHASTIPTSHGALKSRATCAEAGTFCNVGFACGCVRQSALPYWNSVAPRSTMNQESAAAAIRFRNKRYNPATQDAYTSVASSDRSMRKSRNIFDRLSE